MTEKIRKTDAEWRKDLTPQQYHVTRQKGTEPPGTGEYEDHGRAGHLRLRVLRAAAVSARTPNSIPAPAGRVSMRRVDETKVEIERDISHGMMREEVLCSRCDAHLGHVFPDGPRPTGPALLHQFRVH